MNHIPVLLQEVVQALSISPEDVVLDATLGLAGHAYELSSRLSSKGVLIGIDADADALEAASHRLSNATCKKILIQDNFARLPDLVKKYMLPKFDAVLFDLGWGTHTLSRSKGFSFQSPDDPLLMTYGDASITGVTARDILNEWSEETIALILKQYGGEGRSAALARQIITDRARAPYMVVSDLLTTVQKVIPKKTSRVHPATKTFQALRIAVNNELGILPQTLEYVVSQMNTGARLAVITFHGTEDTLVKQALLSLKREGKISLINKHVIKASRNERLQNPRARSAQLRICKKI